MILRNPFKQKAKRGAAKSRDKTMPAPVRGWNAREGLPEMNPQDAVIMDNMFPGTTDVQLRKGSTNWSTGYPAKVETLMVYAGAAVRKLFAASGTSFYDATSSGAVGAAVVTGLANARWQYTNNSTPGGNFLAAVNGVDKLQLYDGSTWKAIDGASTPAITGVATTSLTNVSVNHNRMWFTEKNSLDAWYLGVNAISGAAQAFPLGSIFNEGGSLVCIGGWTIDAGQGMDDLTCFVTTEGEIAVYGGSDPSSASTWSLRGVYKLADPIGFRCLEKFASDLLVVTKEGLFPMSKALASAQVNTKTSITDRISSAMRAAVATYGSLFGWECHVHSSQGFLLLNIPLTASGYAMQFVMNTISGAWCRFKSWNALCFADMNGELYFGSQNAVLKAWEGGSDNGSQIVGVTLQAFNALGYSGPKNATMIQPLVSATGVFGAAYQVRADYDLTLPSGVPSLSGASASLYGTAVYGSSVWGGTSHLYKDWITSPGFGRVLAVVAQFASSDGEVHWYSTTFKLEDGAGL